MLLQVHADFVVTDDRAFLKALREAGLPHVTSALALVELILPGSIRQPANANAFAWSHRGHIARQAVIPKPPRVSRRTP